MNPFYKHHKLIFATIFLLTQPYVLHAASKECPTNLKIAKDDLEKENQPAFLDNVSSNFTLTSNYIFRGISLTADKPAAQAGIAYTFPLGIYANLWGSNADYNAPDGKKVTIEFDTALGVEGKFHNDYTYDINIVRYNYPGARDANYNELNTLWGYKIIEVGISYSGDYAGSHSSGTYINVQLDVPIPPRYTFNIDEISFLAETGHYSLANSAGRSYNDYMLGLNKKFGKNYSFLLQGTGTNHRAHEPPYDGNKLVATINAAF